VDRWTVADIQARRFPSGPKTVEYRIHFAMSCKLIYYYDLVTVLAPRLQEALDQRRMGFLVKAGEAPYDPLADGFSERRWGDYSGAGIDPSDQTVSCAWKPPCVAMGLSWTKPIDE